MILIDCKTGKIEIKSDKQILKEAKMTEIPEFKSEDEERDFWATHDSVDFLEGAEQVNLEEKLMTEQTQTNKTPEEMQELTEE